MIEKVASSAYDRTERPGVAWLVLLLAAALVGVMAVYFLAPASAPRVTMAALAMFAVAGVFSLFAYAVGLLQFTSRAARNDVTKLISDTWGEGLLATEGELQILYANEAYMELCGARDVSGILPVERLFSGPPEVSEAIYRLAQAARGGQRHVEDMRLSPPLMGGATAAWYRIRVQPLRASRPQYDALGGGRRDLGPATPGKCFPATAACDRFSRSRAGGLFLGDAGRRHPLYEQDAGRLARL